MMNTFRSMVLLSLMSGGLLAQSWENLGGFDPGPSANVMIEHNGDLYVGGSFGEAGGTPGADMIARWDDGNWQAIGGGLNGTVNAMVFVGNDLYVGGYFENAGGIEEADFLAMWNGTSWSAVGSGITGFVAALATDGTNLYVGGNFISAGGVAGTMNIAKWDGENWSALNTGLNAMVNALAMGTGATLYAGGQFSNAGGNANADYVAMWDGDSWEALGTGTDYDVSAIAVSGTDVYVGGLFIYAGGLRSKYIAHWNGSTWLAMDSTFEAVSAVAVHDGDVYASGNVNMTSDAGNPTGVVVWNGSDWIDFGGGIASGVRALLSTESGLVIGSGPSFSGSPVIWNGSSFSFFGSGLAGSVEAIATSGSNVYIGGYFTDAFKNTDLDHIAMWDGDTWSSPGSGLNGYVSAIAVSGSNVYVGGQFTDAGGNANADKIAVWNGSAWSALGTVSGIEEINAIVVSGTDVYVGGRFSDLGGNPNADNIAKWNGSSWEALGNGLAVTVGDAFVYSIVVAGSDVYVGGYFEDAGGISTADNIAKWNGSSWSALGGGLNGNVYGIAVIGSDIYAGGEFDDIVGGESESLKRVAKWNGSTWEELGGGVSNNETSVQAMIALGSHVYAGGSFAEIGGVNTTGVALWDGDSWQALGDGLNNSVSAMAISGDDVYMGGDFLKTGSESLNRFAVWHAPSQVDPLTVTSTADDSTAGTLRYAIAYANAHGGPDYISFDATLAGQTITLSRKLSVLTDDYTTIDGDANGNQVASIHISGPSGDVGFDVSADSCTIQNLSIGNLGTAIVLSGTGNSVLGCKLGLTLTDDSAPLANAGIIIQTGYRENWVGNGTAAGRNYICNSLQNGITIRGPRNHILGNYIGLKSDGTTAATNNMNAIFSNRDSNDIGDGTPGGRNVIAVGLSETGATGIYLSSGKGNRILGNYIGTDATGLLDRSGNHNILFISGASDNIVGGGTTEDGTANVIAGGVTGLWIAPEAGRGHQITGNYVGVGSDGVTPIENSTAFWMFSDSNYLANNVIANNYNGITIDQGHRLNRFFQNSIFDNTNEAVLFTAGSQDDVAPPRITSVSVSQVSGHAAPNAPVQIFVDDNDQGEVFVETVLADEFGEWSFAGSLEPGKFVTAMQDSNGNTSDFSVAAQVPDPLMVVNTNDAGAGSLREAIDYANAHEGPDTIRFDPSIAGQTIYLSSQLPSIVDGETVIDGDIDQDQVASIQLDAAGLSTGFFVTSSHNEFKYLSIVNANTLININSSGNGHNKFVGNKLGLTLNDSAAGFVTYGIIIGTGADHNWIGDGTAAGRNYIAGRGATNHSAIFIGSKHNHIVGNYVGLKPDGMTPAPNNEGIYLNGDSNFVGDGTAGGGNYVAANVGNSIIINGVKGNRILGNVIGTDTQMSADLGAPRGIIIFNGATENMVGDVAEHHSNTIVGSNSEGVYISGNGTNNNRIIANNIGSTHEEGVYIGNNYGIRLESNSMGTYVAHNSIAANTTGIAAQGGTSQNRFFFNGFYEETNPIFVSAGSQQDVAAPRITGYATGNLTGTASPFALVQVYSLDQENNDYSLMDTTRSDGGGHWSLVTSISAGQSVVALQDSNGNTSDFSMVFTETSQAAGILVFNPDTARFPDVEVGSSAQMNVVVYSVDGPTTVDSILVWGNFALISAPSTPFDISEGDSVVFTIEFTPDSDGSSSAFLQFFANGQTTPVNYMMEGTGIAPTAGTLSALTASVGFGSRRVAIDSTTSELRLVAAGSAVEVSGISSPLSTDFMIVSSVSLPVTLTPGVDTLKLVVKFKPAAVGLRSDTIAFTGNASNGTVKVALSGTGQENVAPGVQLSILRSTVVKHQIEIYTAADETIQSIEGTATLGSSTSLSFTNVNAQLYVSRYTLTASGSLNLNITVTDAVGNSTLAARAYAVGSLNRASNTNIASDDDQVQVSAKGTGYLMLGRSPVAPPADLVGQVWEILATEEISGMTLKFNVADPSSGKRYRAYRWEAGEWVHIGGNLQGQTLSVTAMEAGTYAVVATDALAHIPESLELHQNYPNPFNPSTTIRFGLSQAGAVKLTIYNIMGQKVRELVNETRPAGMFEVIWDGRNLSGQAVSTGVYLYRLETPEGVLTRKLTLLK